MSQHRGLSLRRACGAVWLGGKGHASGFLPHQQLLPWTCWGSCLGPPEELGHPAPYLRPRALLADLRD